MIWHYRDKHRPKTLNKELEKSEGEQRNGIFQGHLEEKVAFYTLRKFFESWGILHWCHVLRSRTEEQSNFF